MIRKRENSSKVFVDFYQIYVVAFQKTVLFPFISRGNKLSSQKSHYFVLPEDTELFKPRYGMLDSTSEYLYKILQNIPGCEKLT